MWNVRITDEDDLGEVQGSGHPGMEQ